MNSFTALASPLVSALALLTGLVGILGARFGLIAPIAGFNLFAFLMPVGLFLGLILGLIGVLRTRPRQRRGDVAPAEALRRARHTAEDLGWTQILDDGENGRLEFVDTSPWFGFVDYVAVRVRPVDGGAAVDVRSVSQIGIGDGGKNAARIRHYLDELTSE